MSKHHKGGDKQPSSRQDATNAPRSNGNSNGSHAQTVTDSEQNQEIHSLEGRIKRGEKYMIGLTAAMVATGFLQWHIAKRQVEEAVKSVQMDERAWVTVARIDNGVPVLGRIFKPLAVLHNSGRTPAREVGVRHRYEAVGVSVIGSVDKIRYPESEWDYEPTSGERFAVLPPNGEGKIGDPVLGPDGKTPIVVTPDLIEALHNGNVTLYLIGRVVYKDVFDQSHRTKYCFRLDPREGGYVPCEKHNDVD